MPGSPAALDTSPTCAFGAIIRGEAPAAVIVETEHLLAFLDIRPLFRGHTLLVPKAHLRLLSDLPVEQAAEFLSTAQRLERAVEDGLGAAGSMILVNNVISQSVPHLHLHVIPRNEKDGLRFWLGPRHPYDSADEAEEYAAKIRAALPSRGLPREAGRVAGRGGAQGAGEVAGQVGLVGVAEVGREQSPVDSVAHVDPAGRLEQPGPAHHPLG
jgi:histidine triad (HIT) family protein